MEKDGLVKRVPKRKGHPFTEVKLTERGRELCEPGIEVLKKLIVDLASDMSTEEQKRLQDALRPLRDKMLDALHMEVPKPAIYEGKPIPLVW
jgi:DNA-binding MarR family transcriptional regulator